MPLAPFKLGDRVVRREDDDQTKGTVVDILRDARYGEDQLLRVYWENGLVEEISGSEVLSWIEKAAPGTDLPRCPVCRYVLPNHDRSCPLAR